MKLSFTKMHGCGNSYLYFNCFSQSVNDPAALAQCLSDVHFGVGSDGIILICPSEVADAKMRMFNADGSEGKMCGNGIRCVGKFLYDYGLVDGRTEITVETLSGIKHLTLYPENGQVTRVRVDMGQAILTPAAIPCTLPQQAGAPLTVRGTTYAATAVGMGNPHCVLFQQDDVDGLDLEQIGPTLKTIRLSQSASTPNSSMFSVTMNSKCACGSAAAAKPGPAARAHARLPWPLS